ncbi:MAG: hypothetical protein PWP23_2930 [Candidatus Sumerlaeota bacterium]|nr:hypothetical protein [Candidatus Sumerlaeota bacterium]
MGLFDRMFGKKPSGDLPAIDRRDPETKASPPGSEADWEDQGTPQEMQPAEVREALAGSEPPQLLDVREPHELKASGWIPGAIHIPMAQVQTRLGELDKTRPVVVYCARGMRSFDVGFLLIENGFKNVSNLNGGMHAWDGDVAWE